MYAGHQQVWARLRGHAANDSQHWQQQRQQSYPACRLCVFVLQQADEVTKHLLDSVHVVGAAALQDPALPPGQGLQLKVLLDLPKTSEKRRR